MGQRKEKQAALARNLVCMNGFFAVESTFFKKKLTVSTSLGFFFLVCKEKVQ